jgi:alkyl sulfatase BDS1-like metallo-beta-lactamase superfamily hydrolase
VKAIYQRYMGWFDGNPAHLWAHPPVEAARRYVDFMGGADAVEEKARVSFETGDFRWVAEVLNHVVFAEPLHARARELLADTYEQLGYGSENGTWRGFYLTGATELRDGQVGTPTETASRDVIGQLSPEMAFDAIAVRVDGPKAWDEKLTIDIRFTDSKERYRLQLGNGALTYSAAERIDAADATLEGPRASLSALAAGSLHPDALVQAGINPSGDVGVLGRLASVLDTPDPNFAIVTPETP